MIAPGTRLGPYVITAPIGAGGMGEVYKATDPRLGRDVAIKVVPPAFSADPERLNRFEQEARAAAALNHPNILAVHDIGQHDASPYIVSELLEGETLRERLNGGALPVRKAVEYAIQIAHGLAAAHERGITHRDLKPENIFITTDGRAKILDFGLAKLTQSEPALAGLSELPTTPPNTLPGVVLGTIGYMAPEQVRGQHADHRSDIFAFGTIVYEMLAGQRTFQRETAAETMTAILKDDPPALPAVERHIPPVLARVVDRCLEKSPAARFKSADDLAFALETLSAHSDTAVPAAIGGRRALLSRAPLAWSVAALLAVVVAVLAIVATLSVRRGASPTRPVTRLELNLPPGVELFTFNGDTVAVSPDGTRVAFIGVRGAVRQIYVRALDELDAVPIRGTDNAWMCFFSPDGRSIGFIAADSVMRTVSLADGLVATVASTMGFEGAAWGSDDRIVFVRSGALWRVSASGGAPEQLMMLDAARKEVLQAWPTALPGADAILFESSASGGDARIEALVLATRERRVIVERGNHPRYMQSGHLTFYRDGELLAAPFDAANLSVTGSPRPVIQNVPESGARTPVADVSDTGTLVYAPATATARLVWVSRQGTEQSLAGEPRLYANPRLAPGATRLLVQAGSDVWVQDLTRSTFTRATSVDVAVGGAFPVWAPDGRVVFRSGTGLRTLSAETGRPSEVIAGTGALDYPGSVSHDGERLVFVRLSPDTSGDIYVASLRGDSQIRPVLTTPAYEGSGRLSPDSRWIAYSSNESGRMEVFIAPFPQVDRKLQVSTDGGTQPVWNPNGREIFYRNGTKMMSVTVSTSPDLALGAPHLLFDVPYAFGTGITIPNYDVSPDGQRFVMVKSESGAGRLNVVLNWSEELNRRVPVD